MAKCKLTIEWDDKNISYHFEDNENHPTAELLGILEFLKLHFYEKKQVVTKMEE